jgi:flagellar protein FliO/FliZ
MTKLIPLSRAAATAAAALGTCLASFACPGQAFAKGTGTSAGENTLLNLNSDSSAAHVGSGGASIVRTVVGLAIVIAVIWGLSWILRQVKSGRDPQLSSAGLASVSALTLSTGRSVHLVRAGNEYVLLASAEHGVVPIHRYSEEEAREAGLLPVDESPPRSRGSLLAPRASSTPAHGRHDPMRMPSPSSGVLERVRDWTVRR